jgi:hypothetical protein
LKCTRHTHTRSTHTTTLYLKAHTCLHTVGVCGLVECDGAAAGGACGGGALPEAHTATGAAPVVQQVEGGSGESAHLHSRIPGSASCLLAFVWRVSCFSGLHVSCGSVLHVSWLVLFSLPGSCGSVLHVSSGMCC